MNHSKAEMDRATVKYKLQRQEQLLLKVVEKLKDQSKEMDLMERKLNALLKKSSLLSVF